ncbi:MAG: SidA/IucD/PvdA family monooxygenase [Comamonas sp.]
MSTAAPDRDAALNDPDAAARETLRLLGPLPANWVPEHAGIAHNVVIVGGGQTGTAIAFALARAGIGGVAVIDAAPNPAKAGVWRNRARMLQLRTLKSLVGPDLGLPGLSFQAWYEARHGRAAYDALDRIPRTVWADYLDWFREFLGIGVRYGTRLRRIEPVVAAGETPAHLRLHLQIDGQWQTVTTRKLVLANGVAGNGAPYLPEELEALRGSGLVSHTADDIDFAALRGKTVAVVGAAASAFDAAATALEAGAAAVHLLSRRDHIAATPIAKLRGYPGLYDNYLSLPDAVRWSVATRWRRVGSTPPADSVQRVLDFEHFHLHLATPWPAASVKDGQIHAQLHGEAFAFDHVIAGTGYSTDPAQRPELQGVAEHVLRWRDRYAPPADERDEALAASPYLGSGLEYLEKTPGAAPWLGAIHVYNPAGFASVGLPLGDVPSLRRDVPALVRRISADLLHADWALHETRINGDVPPDFGPELYGKALYRPAQQREAA